MEGAASSSYSSQENVNGIFSELSMNHVELDGKLWRKLPEELLTAIMAHLDLPNLFRLRSVCKKWNSTLRDPTILAAGSRSYDGPPFCIRSNSDDCRHLNIYNRTSNVWHVCSYSSLFSPPLPSKSHRDGFLLLKAVGGLLLLQAKGNPNGPLFLVNPVNKTYKQLPGIIHDVKSMGVDRSGDKQVHKILAWSKHCFQVYDSEDNSWDLLWTGDLGVSSDLYSLLEPWRYDPVPPPGPVYHKGYWYFFTPPDGDLLLRHGPLFAGSIGRFRQGSELVQHVIKTPSCEQSFRGFLEISSGHLLFVGAKVAQRQCLNVLSVRWLPLHKIESVHVWQLKIGVDSAEWIEIARMPDELFERIYAADSIIACNADGNYIQLIFGFFRVYKRSMSCSEQIMCDVPNNLWRYIPACKNGKGLAVRNVFMPRLGLIL